MSSADWIHVRPSRAPSISIARVGRPKVGKMRWKVEEWIGIMIAVWSVVTVDDLRLDSNRLEPFSVP